jgi:hypothetical protein
MWHLWLTQLDPQLARFCLEGSQLSFHFDSAAAPLASTLIPTKSVSFLKEKENRQKGTEVLEREESRAIVAASIASANAANAQTKRPAWRMGSQRSEPSVTTFPTGKSRRGR